MPTVSLLYPVFLQVALTFGLLFMLGPARVAAVKRGEVKIKDIALGQQAWPPQVTQIANSYNNQFQLPVLFYALVGIVIITRKIDTIMVALAWAFVLSRVLHAYVHVTSNYIAHRFRAFVVGAFVLLAMWLWFAWRVAGEGV